MYQQAKCSIPTCPNPMMRGCPDCGRGFCSMHCKERELYRTESKYDRFAGDYIDTVGFNVVLCDDCAEQRQKRLDEGAERMLAHINKAREQEAARKAQEREAARQARQASQPMQTGAPNQSSLGGWHDWLSEEEKRRKKQKPRSFWDKVLRR
jgi:hypothetical protein